MRLQTAGQAVKPRLTTQDPLGDFRTHTDVFNGSSVAKILIGHSLKSAADLSVKKMPHSVRNL